MLLPPPAFVGARYTMDGRIYEIINLTPDLVSLRDVDGKRLQYVSPDDFEALVFKKEITLYQLAPLQESNATYFLHSSDPNIKMARRKNYYVDGLQKAFSGTLPKKASQAEIKRLAQLYPDEHPPSYSTVWKWSRLRSRLSGSPFALLKQKSRLPRGKKTPDDTMAIIKRYIDEAYLTEQKNTVAYVHRLIRGQIIHDNMLRRENNAKLLVIPSLSTLHRCIQNQCRFRQDGLRLGQRTAQKNNKFGILWEEPKNLLEQVELDCTPLDLLLVNDAQEVIGRLAHLQAAIDVRSEKIIAYDLSLTPPCAEKTLRSLKMALTTVTGEELQRGKMQELIVDNGSEVANVSVKVAADVLGIHLRFVPPETPDAKPHIERFFKTLNSSFVHTLPGTTFSNPGDRGDYDSAAKACFTIEQVQSYFSEWLHGYYHNHEHSRLHMSPNEQWDKDMRQQFPPQKYSKYDLDRLLRSVIRRSINGGRVTFLNLSWTGPGLAEMESRLKPGKKAIIYYDPSNLQEVLVTLPDRPDELFRATATRPVYQKNLTLFEHQLVRKQMETHNDGFSESSAVYALWQLRQKIMDDYNKFNLKRRKKINSPSTAAPSVSALPSDLRLDEQSCETVQIDIEEQQGDYEVFYLTPQASA